MTNFKGKKPTVKDLNQTIAARDKTIEELNNDLHALAEMLEREQNTVRVPKDLTVIQYNSLIDHLIKNRPEPVFPAEVPEKVQGESPGPESASE